MQVWLLLFNDLLLITRKDGKIFTVQEEPILLDDLRLSDTGNDHTPAVLHYYVAVHCTGAELLLYVKDTVSIVIILCCTSESPDPCTVCACGGH